jgi:hypothetical protein
MAENSRIGSAPPRASARGSLTPPAALRLSCEEARTWLSPTSGCRQPRRGAGFEGFSISRPDLANGASRQGNAPRLARFRSDSAAAIWRKRLFRAMTAAPVVSLPLRTSACASVPATRLTRSACLRSRSVRNDGAGGLSLHQILCVNWGGHIAPDRSDGGTAITIRHLRCAQSECALLRIDCKLA